MLSIQHCKICLQTTTTIEFFLNAWIKFFWKLIGSRSSVLISSNYFQFEIGYLIDCCLFFFLNLKWKICFVQSTSFETGVVVIKLKTIFGCNIHMHTHRICIGGIYFEKDFHPLLYNQVRDFVMCIRALKWHTYRALNYILRWYVFSILIINNIIGCVFIWYLKVESLNREKGISCNSKLEFEYHCCVPFIQLVAKMPIKQIWNVSY